MKETESTIETLDKKGFNLRQVLDYAVSAMLDSNSDTDNININVYGIEIKISRAKTIDFTDLE